MSCVLFILTILTRVHVSPPLFCDMCFGDFFLNQALKIHPLEYRSSNQTPLK